MKVSIQLLSLTFVVFFSDTIFSEWNETPDYWKCYNRVSGEWSFGVAPYGCDANAFGSDQHISRNYEPVLFVQSRDYGVERNRYMQETYSMIKAVAAYYIQARKPNVTSSEQAAFEQAALTIAHQESYWSHYRQASQDGRYKMMRGDFGHGHGLMQVDDRAHYTATRQGKGWELITNMMYSLDEYYTAWRSADLKWCIQQYGNTWRNRSREAYSQYNGGPRASCRWTDPNHRWARNDKGFAQKYDGRSWESYVTDKQQNSTINVSCLANGGTHCPPNGGVDTSDWYQKLLQTDDNAACVYDGKQLHCVTDIRHSACLTSVGRFDSNSVLRLDAGSTNGISRITYNPHKLCFDNVLGLAAVGSFIELTQDNNLRLKPNGELIRSIDRGVQLQVLDIVVFDNQELKRFYKVKLENDIGYIWGGTKTDYQQWSVPTLKRSSFYELPVFNDWVAVQVDRLNMRATPGGDVLKVIDKGTKLLVKGVVTRDYNNKIYLHISHNGEEGYIYAGYLIPNSTLSYWVEKTTPQDQSHAAYCPEGTDYDFSLMVCRNEIDAYGPFSENMRQRCNERGGGQACEQKHEANINGQLVELHRWSTRWFMSVRENSTCPIGTFRSDAYGFHCVEKNNMDEIIEVYGPFDSAMVSRCIAADGGDACYFNRWSASGYRSWNKP
ncbi:SH3 domain-containing protein [Pleionea litopenaei]|uniref:SH3 domain-containing protein n=1 Tax=Pleionea litopenaei TaxID=3070815 RepID=A0AA51X6B2_9GAMM|nr:SH3 domain-containing protein [Pleionea sp. HL-JVS1]WMS86636.1 SH3 domain-containing protein [Pleionea sp. HL-JVS1]